MKSICKQKKIFSFLLVSVLLTFVFCFFVEVEAATNGIGTVNQTYSRTIIPGVTYTYTESDNGDPQKNYVLEYDPKTTGVEALAVYGEYAFGGDTLSKNIALAESRGYTVIAGINGSPFDTSNGTTTGTLISDGRIISANAGVCNYDSFAIREDGSMFIGTSNLTFKYKTEAGSEVNINTVNKQRKTNNNNVYLYTNDFYSDTTSLAESTEIILNVDSGRASIGEQMVATVEEIKEGVKRTAIPEGKIALVAKNLNALGNLKVGEKVTFDFINNDTEYDWTEVEQSVGGFYEILKDGEYVNVSDPAVHPRTTVGFKADGTIVFFVVDGRQPTFSVGLTDLECAQYMKSLGCVAAIRMDGGGSSTMGLRLPGDNNMTTVNSPSDGQERNDADGLLLVLKEDYDQSIGSETLLHAYPNNVALLEGTVMDITVKATDERYNAKTTPEYSLEVVGDCGSITEDGKFAAKQGAGEGKVKIVSGNSETYVDVTVTDKVDEIYATVNNLALSPNEKVQLNVKAYYNDGLLTCSNESFTWTCSPEIGIVNEKGIFTATASAGVSGKITVSHGNANFNIVVTVGQLPQEITGFENDTCGNGTGQWRNSQVGQGSGSCSINTNLNYVRYGEKSLKIDFNLAGTTGTVGTQIWTGANMTISGTPTAIGMWVYATPSAKGAWIRLQYQQTGSSGALYADFGTIDWEGWKYLEADIDPTVNYPISVRFLIRIMGVNESQRLNGTIYVDNLRAVYGFTNDDFDSPVVSNITPNEKGITNTTTQTISFDVTDSGSGVNKEKIEFYLDDKKIDNILFKDIQGGYTVSWTPSSLIPLKEGTHKIKMRAEDNYSNYVVKEWSLVVDSKLPMFSLTGSGEAAVNQENVISLKATSLLLRSVTLEMNYDPAKLEVLDIEAVYPFELEEKLIDSTNGKITIKVINTIYVEDSQDVVNIKYKALETGDMSIKTDKVEYVYSELPKLIATNKLDDFNIQAKVIYDYDSFIELVNKIDSENILLSLNELKEASKELDKFDINEVERKDVLEAVNKLNDYISEYNNILSMLLEAKKTSSFVNNQLGGIDGYEG